MPSVVAFCASSMRRTSACLMMGTCGGGGILLRDPATLQPFARVLQRVLVGVGRQARRLQAGRDAGVVHELEHVGEATVRLAEQPAAAVAVVAEAQRGRSVAAQPELVLDAGGHHVVEFTAASRPR